jgi:hypothetical protein
MFSIDINRRQQNSHAYETFFQKMHDLSCKFYVTTYMQDTSKDYESTVVLWKTYSFPRKSLARAIVSFFTERRFSHPHLQDTSTWRAKFIF